MEAALGVATGPSPASATPSVDFAVGAGPAWRVELVSLLPSDAVKRATWSTGVTFGQILCTDADDLTESEEGEFIKAQERIGEKAHDGKRPIKFPAPGAGFNMIVVDARGFLGTVPGVIEDWDQIVIGTSTGQPGELRAWTNPKSGKRSPTRGLWEPGNPTRSAQTLRERLHVIAVAEERRFTDGELAAGMRFYPNPHLFADEGAAKSALNTFPLWKGV